MSKLYPNLSKLERARLELYARLPHCAPDFMPEAWRKTDEKNWLDVEITNSCYAYSVHDPCTRRDYKESNVPPIGINSGEEIDFKNTHLNHKKFKKLLKNDGLIFAGSKKPNPPPPGCFAVAAFSCDYDGHPNGRLYHFYRLDRDGYWSHKCGIGPVEGHDKSGEPIKDPRDHARHEKPYKDMQFIGYFYIPNSGIALGRRDSILPVQTSDPTKRRTPLQQPDLIQRTMRARFGRANDAR